MSVTIKFDADGNIVSVGPAVFAKMKAKPINKWGHRPWCHSEEIGMYPDDNSCVCGLAKHHCHCVCGGIVQVG